MLTAVLRLALVAFVLGAGVTVEVLDRLTGHPIEKVNEECEGSAGSCQWRVLYLSSGSPEAERQARLEAFLRAFAFLPGVLVYPAAASGAVILGVAGRSAAGLRARALNALGAAACLAVLVRFVWLGVFSAVWR